MLHYITIGFLLACISCVQTGSTISTSDSQTSKQSNISENFNWILGNWKRVNESPGKETFERWEKNSETAYSGIGYTLQNGDTINSEKMQLIKVKDRWDLHVNLPEEINPTIFTGINKSSNQYICENPSNDFPTQIKYWREGNKLHALISGDGMEIPFVFEKLK